MLNIIDINYNVNMIIEKLLFQNLQFLSMVTPGEKIRKQPEPAASLFYYNITRSLNHWLALNFSFQNSPNLLFRFQHKGVSGIFIYPFTT